MWLGPPCRCMHSQSALCRAWAGAYVCTRLRTDASPSPPPIRPRTDMWEDTISRPCFHLSASASRLDTCISVRADPASAAVVQISQWLPVLCCTAHVLSVTASVTLDTSRLTHLSCGSPQKCAEARVQPLSPSMTHAQEAKRSMRRRHTLACVQCRPCAHVHVHVPLRGAPTNLHRPVPHNIHKTVLGTSSCKQAPPQDCTRHPGVPAVAAFHVLLRESHPHTCRHNTRVAAPAAPSVQARPAHARAKTNHRTHESEHVDRVAPPSATFVGNGTANHKERKPLAPARARTHIRMRPTARTSSFHATWTLFGHCQRLPSPATAAE